VEFNAEMPTPTGIFANFTPTAENCPLQVRDELGDAKTPSFPSEIVQRFGFSRITT
jgi:hypothetical protein